MLEVFWPTLSVFDTQQILTQNSVFNKIKIKQHYECVLTYYKLVFFDCFIFYKFIYNLKYGKAIFFAQRLVPQ